MNEMKHVKSNSIHNTGIKSCIRLNFSSLVGTSHDVTPAIKQIKCSCYIHI